MLVQRFSAGALFLLLLLAGKAGLAQEPGKPSFVQGQHLIVAQVSGSNEFLAYSKTSGAWKRHTFPEGVSAVPVMGGSVCAFALSGKPVKELVAVDRQGNWRRMRLPEPTANECLPVVAEALAVYSVDGQAHAFSAELGTWDSIATSEPAAVSADIVTIVTEDRIAVFSAARGNWAVAQTTKH